MCYHCPVQGMLLSILALVFSSTFAIGDCNTDCNKDCCRAFGICEPTCKISCDASKKLCQGTGVNLGHLPNPLGQSCIARFQTVTNALIISQGFYPAGSDYMINEAKGALIRSGLFAPNEFDGVQIRWCSLSGPTLGVAADAGVICLSDGLLNSAAHFGTAVILAHEMTHIRQYRRDGTDNFKCAYSQQYLQHGASYGNSFETEAYDFENNTARPLLTNMWWQAQQRQQIGPSSQSSSLHGWRQVGVGDCAGRDTYCSAGAAPNAAVCAQHVGTIAVCWGNRPSGFPVGPNFATCQGQAAWCTYKSATPTTCSGGGAPGTMWICQ